MLNAEVNAEFYLYFSIQHSAFSIALGPSKLLALEEISLGFLAGFAADDRLE